MPHLYLLRWSQQLSAPYLYGASVEYLHNDTVKYSDQLLSPGAELVNWQNLQKDENPRMSMRLPYLRHGQRYQFVIDASSEPNESVGLAVEYLDEEDERIDQELFGGYDGEFDFPAEAEDYRISLLNLNHQKLLFHDITLAEAPLLTDYQVEFAEKPALVAVIPKESPELMPLEIVVTHAHHPIDELRFHEDCVTLFMELPLHDRDDKTSLAQLRTYLRQHFTKAHVDKAEIRAAQPDTVDFADQLVTKQKTLYSE